ncbi:transposase family protein [Spiroplasma poulsonii]|uniref:transposase family protein n=1 Tax=Spiroplasma poulsonii TaxID=2138 RepID=UPI0038D4AC62
MNDYFTHKTIIIDATETPIQRPKKTKQSYSGKRKTQCIKTQVLSNKKPKIIATSFLPEKHDYALFEESKIPILKNTKLILMVIKGIQKSQ